MTTAGESAIRRLWWLLLLGFAAYYFYWAVWVRRLKNGLSVEKAIAGDELHAIRR